MAVPVFLKETTLVRSAQSLLVVAFGSLLLYIIVNEVIRSKARLVGMKGPRGYPLIGNLWDIRVNAAEQYRKWATKFGDVYQIQLGNIPVVVVNSAATARSIFGQNSQALSSRPEFYTFHKVRPLFRSHVSSRFGRERLRRKNRHALTPTSPGRVQHSRNDDRYLSVLRIAQAPAQGCGVGAEPAVSAHVRQVPGLGEPRLHQ